MILILYTVPVSYFIKLLSFSDSDERPKSNMLHVLAILFNYIFVLFTLQSGCEDWLSLTDLFTACILIINQSQTTTTVFSLIYKKFNFKEIIWRSKRNEKLVWSWSMLMEVEVDGEVSTVQATQSDQEGLQWSVLTPVRRTNFLPSQCSAQTWILNLKGTLGQCCVHSIVVSRTRPAPSPVTMKS